MRSGRKQTYSVLCDGGDKVYKDGKIWLALNDAGEEICLLPGKANRQEFPYFLRTSRAILPE